MSAVPPVRASVPLLAATALALAGCGPVTPPVAETPPPQVTVSRPVVREVTDYDDFDGRIAAIPKVEVRARVRGHLIKVNFQDGQLVREGQLLYEIDPRPYQATLDSARAQEKAAEAGLEFANADYNRIRALAAKQAASREDLDTSVAKQATARADLLKARAAVGQAELDLNFCRITAPFAGQVGRSMVDVGNLVNPAGGETVLTTVVAEDPMYVYFDVDERSLLRYMREGLLVLAVTALGSASPCAPAPMLPQALIPSQVGAWRSLSQKEVKTPVYVGLDGEDGYPHKGLLDFADNAVNPRTGTILVRGVLPNSGGMLGDGMRARVRVPVSAPHEALLITERAVGTEQGQKYVYVIDDQDVAGRRDVTPGRPQGGLVVITQGLNADDWVVVNGTQRVRDGMKVQPRRVPMPGAGPAAPSTQQTAGK
jgi:RND family efflux transporter MFP subunit